jgi:membrane peptidoglycan carboxypeptidase
VPGGRREARVRGRGARVRVGVVAGVLAGCLGLAGCVSLRPLELVPADRVAQTSLVLDAGGRRLAALHGPEDRTAVPLERVSPWMRVAVVDTEDARFWRHGGVDWLAVARAAARDLEHGRVVEGGSTITQQYVKNTYVTGERTLRRKLAEAGHAWGLERRNGKQASSRPTSTPCTSARGPPGWRRPPRPTSRPGRPASP